jgi:hypothetical protein
LVDVELSSNRPARPETPSNRGGRDRAARPAEKGLAEMLRRRVATGGGGAGGGDGGGGDGEEAEEGEEGAGEGWRDEQVMHRSKILSNTWLKILVKNTKKIGENMVKMLVDLLVNHAGQAAGQDSQTDSLHCLRVCRTPVSILACLSRACRTPVTI